MELLSSESLMYRALGEPRGRVGLEGGNPSGGQVLTNEYDFPVLRPNGIYLSCLELVRGLPFLSPFQSLTVEQECLSYACPTLYLFFNSF